MKISDIAHRLQQADIESARLDARLLLKAVTKMDDSDLIVTPDVTLSTEQNVTLEAMIEKRLAGMPVSKIVGHREFYGRDFVVNEHVLDPRADSETLIDVVLEWSRRQDKQDFRILDLGTGSGCLILTLLAELPYATGVAVDISPKAIKIGRQNADKLGLAERIEVTESNWLQNVQGTFDIIVSNPPYIETDVIAQLDKNVRLFDPIQALDGGEDGLVPYKILFPQIRHNLNKGGIVAVECGHTQAGEIKRLMENPRFGHISIHQDIAARDRIVSAVAC